LVAIATLKFRSMAISPEPNPRANFRNKGVPMRSFKIVVLFLLAVLSSAAIQLASAQSLPNKAVPKGMSSWPTNGSGRVLSTKMSGSPSATKIFQALMIGIKGYFDATPKVLNAFRDPRDSQVQASFTASINRVPVTGLIGVATQGNQARGVILFDASREFANSVNRLVTVATGGGASAANVQLTRISFPDGSGSIGLAPGWQLMYANQGAADIKGPQPGTGMSIGANLIVPYTSSDPAQAIQLMAQQQGKNLRLTVIDSKPTPWQNGNAAFVHYRTLMDGQSMDYFGLFAITPYDGNQVFFYTSYIQASSANFPQVLPVGLKIWGSWSVNPAVFAERLNKAAQSMRETSAILSSTNANRQHAIEGINAGWSQYFRDVATLEANGGGRSEVDASFASRVVQNDPNNFRIVPPNELLPR
jgi:hypothetical protein